MVLLFLPKSSLSDMPRSRSNGLPVAVQDSPAVLAAILSVGERENGSVV